MDLHKAVLQGDFLMVRRLVESGVDVNRRDAEGRTPLMLCCLHDGEDWAEGVARMLLMHSGDVGLSDRSGRSALIYAVLYKRVGLIQMFLQALDFDLTAHDCTGQMAQDYANRTGNRTIMELLLQAMRRYSAFSGLMSQNLAIQQLPCSQNSQPTAQRPLEPKPQPASKNALKTVDSTTEIQSGNKSCAMVQNLEPGHSSVYTNSLPYSDFSEKIWTNQENIQKTLGTRLASKVVSKVPNLPPVQRPEPGAKNVSTNLLPYKTLSRKLWTCNKSVQTTLVPKPVSKVVSKGGLDKVKDPEPGTNSVLTNPLSQKTKLRAIQENLHQGKQGPKCVSQTISRKTDAVSEEDICPPVQNPEQGPLAYNNLSKRILAGQETIQRTLGLKHQTILKVTSTVVSQKFNDKTEIKHDYNNSLSVQNPKPNINRMSKYPQPHKTTSKKQICDSVQRNLEPKDHQRSEKASEQTGHGHSPSVTLKNWRLDFRVLMEALQAQNSTSYRPQAQPRPSAPRLRRRFPRQKSRKMSLSALDEFLQKEKILRINRRRCTLAAIPIIKLPKGSGLTVPGPGLGYHKQEGARTPSAAAVKLKVSDKIKTHK